jgi:C1A family cysteine protease
MGLAAWSVVSCTGAASFAQMSTQQLETLRAQGAREGWTFSVGHSEATRRSLRELTGLVDDPESRRRAKFDPLIPKVALPERLNWCEQGACTPIRDQAGCGSCWAFAAIGAMESALRIHEGVSLDLSEQSLVSCRSSGCDGGSFSHALSRLQCDGPDDPCGDRGAVPESYFPYQAADVTCACPYPHPYCIRSWSYVGNGIQAPSVLHIKTAIQLYGPVVASAYVTGPFQAYSGGVFNAGHSTTSFNHALVLVGWDDTQGEDGVWIARNSWGTDWGEDGYMRIEYGCSGIGAMACYIEYTPADCNENDVPDLQDLANGTSTDCNVNGTPDECDLAFGNSTDLDQNDIPDECVTLYVDAHANGQQDGTDWVNAFAHLQDALRAASYPGWFVREIRVAQGTYTPDRGVSQARFNRAATFRLRNGIRLAGGYAGAADPNKRDVRRYPSILSGDLFGDDRGSANRGDNSHHVLTATYVGASAVVDGFTIRGGHAASTQPQDRGGGIYCRGSSPTIISCTFTDNFAYGYGGAMYNGMFGSPSLTECLLHNNRTANYGGAVYNFSAGNPSFVQCTFRGNTSGYGGGAIMDFSSSSSLTNCLFDSNTADFLGGAMLLYSGNKPSITGCTLYGCTAGVGGGAIYSDRSDLTLIDSILWANTAPTGPVAALYGGSMLDVSFCNLHGGDTAIFAAVGARRQWGAGNIDADPLFVPGPSGSFYLSHRTAGNPVDSPCVEAGSDTSAVLGLNRMTTRGDERMDVDIVDLGYHYTATFRPLVAGDFDRDRDVDAADLAAFQSCFARQGPDGVPPVCRIFDFQSDGTVDLDDFAALAVAMTTPR